MNGEKKLGESCKSADERIPILLELPFKHKGIMCAPFIGKVDIDTYLSSGQIEQVICGGENYDGARSCDFEWVKLLRKQCETHQVSFAFIETGTYFVKDGKTYHLPKKLVQSEMAYKSRMNYTGKEMNFLLRDSYGRSIEKENLYEPHFRKNCMHCGSRQICNGCSDCGKCNDEILSIEEILTEKSRK